jgi:hypothetical protein
MKKAWIIFLSCLMVLGLAACNGSSGEQNAPGNADGTTQDNYGDWIEDLN